MKPVRTEDSNVVYVGPADSDIGDLYAQRIGDRPGHVRSVWTFTPGERRAIARGANVALDVLAEPIPPVRLEVTEEQGTGGDAPDVQARLHELRGEGPLT